ncbi:MAG: M56 family metallopeptidase [Verrucomicrobia bacterium]|nr:M56 family metallopeptidase [Verrucomicrobiota bacterium]
MALWILGVLIGAVIGLKQYQLALLLKRQARKLAPDEVTCIQQTLRLDEQTIMDRILVNERIATPMALPSNPGSVVLPEGWLQWSPRLQRAILKHEWHHVDQHDALMGCFMRGFAILFWFNPLAWNLTAAWVAACEHEADLAAVCNDDPVSYADDLLAFARKQSSTANQTFHAQGLPAFTGSKLGQRIALLLSNQGSRSRCLWVTHLSLLTLILSLLGCAWLGRPIAYSDSMREEAATRLSAAAFPADAG